MIILLSNHKGGVGKSTLTFNLAVAYRHMGKSVAILEADPSVRTASRWGSDRDEAGLPHILTVRRLGRLQETLKEMDQHYDIVLVDSAGKDSEEMRSAMTVADITVVPTASTQADFDALWDFKGVLDKAQSVNEKLVVLGVLTKMRTHHLSNDVQEGREGATGVLELADTVVYNRTAYTRTLPLGRGVVEFSDPKAKAEVELLANEILTKGTK